MEYVPDDGGLTVAVLEYLAANPALLAAAEAVREVTPAEVGRLRKGHAGEMVRGALLVTQARRKARAGGKFAGVAELWGSPEAVEQATSTRVARHKAQRIAEYVSGRTEIGPGVWDVCAGIGGDTVELARVAPVTAVEMSAARAWCLVKNCGGQVRVVCAAVDPRLENLPTREELCGAVFHCDPSRRSAGKRRHLWEDMIPGPEVLAALMGRFEAGAIKLSPAVDFASLPEGEVEVISTEGSVVQAVLWTGGLSRGGRSATVMRAGASVTVRGTPADVADHVADPGAFFFEVDGAVHRAGLAGALAGELGLWAVTTDGGYVSGDRAQRHLALAAFGHLETVAFSEKKVIEALRTLPTNRRAVEVKTRGGLDLDTDALQVKWTKAAPCGATVMIYRGQKGRGVASICKRELEE